MMIKFELMREVNRIYNEHYSKCEIKAVHDFYRAVIRRIRRYSVLVYPVILRVICEKGCRDQRIVKVIFAVAGRRYETRFPIPEEIGPDGWTVDLEEKWRTKK